MACEDDQQRPVGGYGSRSPISVGAGKLEIERVSAELCGGQCDLSYGWSSGVEYSSMLGRFGRGLAARRGYQLQSIVACDAAVLCHSGVPSDFAGGQHQYWAAKNGAGRSSLTSSNRDQTCWFLCYQYGMRSPHHIGRWNALGTADNKPDYGQLFQRQWQPSLYRLHYRWRHRGER